MKGKPALSAEAVARAQELAAKGGWPAGAMCSMQRSRTLWAWTVATFFGAGLGKPGPGTWGSVAATLLWAGTVYLIPAAHPWMLALTLAGVVFSVGLGVPAATIAARESGREDPGFVVIDEVAGQWITLGVLALPGLAAKQSWPYMLLALLLFRLFDIFKPFPVRHLEKLPEGWGIVFDDVAAGLYAGAVLLLLVHWI